MRLLEQDFSGHSWEGKGSDEQAQLGFHTGDGHDDVGVEQHQPGRGSIHVDRHRQGVGEERSAAVAHLSYCGGLRGISSFDARAPLVLSFGVGRCDALSRLAAESLDDDGFWRDRSVIHGHFATEDEHAAKNALRE